MSTANSKRLLLLATVLMLPIAAIVMQGIKIAKYEEELDRADMNNAQDMAAEVIRLNISDLLESLKEVLVTTLPTVSVSELNTYQLWSDVMVHVGYERTGELEWEQAFRGGEAEHNPRTIAATGRFGLDPLCVNAGGTWRLWAQLSARGAAWCIVQNHDFARFRVDDDLREELAPDAWLQDGKGMTQSYARMNLSDGVWKVYEGHRIWFIGKFSTPQSSSPMVLAVDANDLAQYIVDVALGTHTGVNLTLDNQRSNFPDFDPANLQISVSDITPKAPSIDEVMVVLVVCLAFSGWYLFWRDAKREAALAELRSQFVSSVSHELKTPLTSIRMFAESLQIAEQTGTDSGERRTEYLEVIVRESERLTRLLNNVLAFSQIERGHRTYHMQPENLQDILKEATRTLRFPLDEKGFELSLSISDDIPPIEVDRDAIEQALLNLLSNAIKFSGQSRKLELSLQQEGTEAVISVTDHGIGIPEPEKMRIFESFYRVSTKDRQAIGGTGLGLAIVDHIARAHHGSVAIESSAGKGSTFRIRIPIDRSKLV